MNYNEGKAAAGPLENAYGTERGTLVHGDTDTGQAMPLCAMNFRNLKVCHIGKHVINLHGKKGWIANRGGRGMA